MSLNIESRSWHELMHRFKERKERNKTVLRYSSSNSSNSRFPVPSFNSVNWARVWSSNSLNTTVDCNRKFEKEVAEETRSKQDPIGCSLKSCSRSDERFDKEIGTRRVVNKTGVTRERRETRGKDRTRSTCFLFLSGYNLLPLPQRPVSIDKPSTRLSSLVPRPLYSYFSSPPFRAAKVRYAALHLEICMRPENTAIITYPLDHLERCAFARKRSIILLPAWVENDTCKCEIPPLEISRADIFFWVMKVALLGQL